MGTEGSPFEFEGIDPFADPLLGKELGPYRIESVLGQGGMGTVYRALHRDLQRPVAIKVLAASLPDMAGEALTRFHQEALAYAAVHHPNVVEIYESGAVGGTNYLALEFVEGRPLADILEEEGPLEFEDILDIGEQLCRALSTIHAAGLVHRDIKLGNVMRDAGGNVKLMDFGVVRARTGKGARASREAAGTLRCMAPEVVEGEPGDSRADIFQVGVLLYELLTDERFSVLVPRYYEDIEQRFFKGAATEVRPDVSDGLKELILRCLQHSPALRFQSAGVLAREFSKIRRLGPGRVNERRLASHRSPQQVRAPSLVARFMSWLRNYLRLNPTHVGIVGMLMLLCVVFVVPLYVFTTSSAPNGTDDGEGERAPATSVLGTSELFEVTGDLTGYRLRWDLTERDNVHVAGSYRLDGGEPVFLSWPLPSSSGDEYFPVEGTNPRRPTTLGWRLMAGDQRLCGGKTSIGFSQRLPGRSSTVRLVKRKQTLAVGSNDGMAVVIDLADERTPAQAPRWSLIRRGQPLTSLLLDEEALYVAFGTPTSQVARHSFEHSDGWSVDSDPAADNSFVPGSGEWISGPVVGRLCSQGARVGEAVYWLATVPGGKRLLLTGLDCHSGTTVYRKTFSGTQPLSPVTIGSDLLVAYRRKGSGVLIRFDGEKKRRHWRHVTVEAIRGSLVLGPHGLFVYFRTEGHVHGLRLFESPPAGERLKAVDFGDFRRSLPGPSSQFAIEQGRLQLVSMPAGELAPRLVSLTFAGSSHVSVTETKLPFVLRTDGAQTIADGPAPVELPGRMVVPLADSLCFFDRSFDEGPRMVRFPVKIAKAWLEGQLLYVVLDDGAVYAARIGA